MVPKRVLVVEDEYLVALDMETTLHTMGVETIIIATTLLQAKNSVAEAEPDCVLLDVNLADGMSYELARQLQDADIPFGFVSGYGDTSGFPEDFVNVPLLDKPFGETELQNFVFQLMDQLSEPEALDGTN